MSDVHRLGLDIVSFSDNGQLDEISRITLLVDDDNYYTAGDDTGMEIEATCPYATQEMADSILSSLRGYQYHAYTAGAANLDPSAELGDSVVVNGVSSFIASIADDGNGFPDISAPGAADVDEEYPMTGYVTNQINLVRKESTENWSSLTKTAEEIQGAVGDIEGNLSTLTQTATNLESRLSDAEGNISTITQTASDIESRVSDAEGNLNTITQSLNGVVYESSLANGTTTINGGCITTGTVNTERIKLGGEMTVYESADSSTTGGVIGFLQGRANSAATDGIGMVDSTGENYVIATTNGIRMQSGDNYFYLTGSLTRSYQSITVSSDRSLKSNIESLPGRYEAMLDAMEPVQFIMNADESGKLHMGYIANDVLSAAKDAGLDESDIAWVTRGADDLLGLRYSEIIPLLHMKIKKLEQRIAQFEQMF